jgi:hypothetical protein
VKAAGGTVFAWHHEVAQRRQLGIVGVDQGFENTDGIARKFRDGLPSADDAMSLRIT